VIDTLKLKSPEVSEEVLSAVESHLRTFQTVENGTGEILSEFTHAGLEGSFDHRTRVDALRNEVRSVPAILTLSGRPEFYTAECRKLLIEGSVHKAMMGHNIFGGPSCPREAARWYVNHVSERLGVDLPPADDWVFLRVDIAEVFNLGDFSACEDYVRALSLAKFPRRKLHKYGDETAGFNGTTTSWKVYHKGPEFAKHDHKRLLRVMGIAPVVDLQEIANGVLRVETSIKAKKLKADHGGNPQVSMVTRESLERIHDVETGRVVRESRDSMKTVRRNEEVNRRLVQVYGESLGGTLFGTWIRLATVGEEELRRTMARRTFYRHRKQLQEAGCSWHGTDVQIVNTAIPEGFSPVRGDIRRLDGESMEVRKQLLAYRVVA